MATIGTFTSTGNGFTGTVRTLALNAKAKLVRVENPSDKGPHFRIFAGNVELGAAWQKTARDTERDYLATALADTHQLDDRGRYDFVGPTLGTNAAGDPFFTDGKIALLQQIGCGL